MFIWWFGLTCVIIALVFTKQTKLYELALIGVWGILSGALALGATAWEQIFSGIGNMIGRVF